MGLVNGVIGKVMKAASLVAMLMCCAVIAGAEDESKHELTLLVGSVASPTKIAIDAEDKLASVGAAIGGRFLRRISPGVMFGGELQTLKPGERTSRTLVSNGVSVTGFESVLGLVEIKVMPRGAKTVRPYGLGGLGLHSTSLRIDTTPQRGFRWSDTSTIETRKLVHSRKTAVALTLQGGVDFPIGKRALFGLSAAWYYLGKARYPSTPQAQRTSPAFREVTGAVSTLSVLAHMGMRL